MTRSLSSALAAVLLAACGTGEEGPMWTFEEVGMDVDGDVPVVTGTLVRSSNLNGGIGELVETRWTAIDGTLLLADEEVLGEGFEPGESGEFTFNPAGRQIVLLPAEGGEPDVCAEIRSDDSNFTDFTPVGCITAEE